MVGTARIDVSKVVFLTKVISADTVWAMLNLSMCWTS